MRVPLASMKNIQRNSSMLTLSRGPQLRISSFASPKMRRTLAGGTSSAVGDIKRGMVARSRMFSKLSTWCIPSEQETVTD